MKRITLCDLRNDTNHYELKATLAEDKLTITGESSNTSSYNNQEVGHFEYHYMLDKENTNLFFKKLKVNQLEEIKEAFHGINASRNFREFCNNNQIHYSYYNAF